MSPVQVLDSLLVVLAQSQRVGEGVVGGHDGARLAGVLQTQDVPELMGGDLQEVCTCRGRGGQRDTPGSHGVCWSCSRRGFCS